MTNIAILTGRIARDPDTRETKGGTDVTGITVVTDRPARDKDGKTYKDENGYLPEHSNPFNGVRRNRKRKIERFLSQDEMARLGGALADARGADPLQSAAVTLLALTGCRRGEIIRLKWSEVKGRRLKLTDSKTGPRLVWLGTEAQAVLSRLQRKRGEDRVFPFEGEPESAIDGFWRQLRKRAGLHDVRLHDLRHNYASHAARSSETLPMIGKLLGHASVNSTQRYAHLDDETILRAASAIGGKLERCIVGCSATVPS